MNLEHVKSHLRKLAKENACEGVFYEPRMYFDDFAFAVGTERVFADPDIFKNTERYPVRITHMTAFMGASVGGVASPPQNIGQGDERLLTRYGLRIRGHDTYYMTQQHVPLPAFHSENVAASDTLTRGSAFWRFPKPVHLGQRDSFVVEAALESNPTTARPTAVTFCGIGRQSRRPYYLQASQNRTDTTRFEFNPNRFIADGAEQVDIGGIAVHCGGPIEDADPVGDIQQLRLGVQQTGNGTQQSWHKGPVATPATLAPAPLWAVTSGRALVHKIPGEGWLWQPGQGVEPELLAFGLSRTTAETVWLAFLGYIIVT